MRSTSILLAVLGAFYVLSVLPFSALQKRDVVDLRKALLHMKSLSAASLTDDADFQNAFISALEVLRSSAGIYPVIVHISFDTSNDESATMLISYKQVHFPGEESVCSVSLQDGTATQSYNKTRQELNLPPPIPPPRASIIV